MITHTYIPQIVDSRAALFAAKKKKKTRVADECGSMKLPVLLNKFYF